MARLIVADAGPLIAFGRIEKLALLPQVLGEVLVPEAVVAECLIDLQKPGASAIREALGTRTLIQIDNPVPALSPFPLLDAGESAAIRLALKLSVPVLIDERAGRKIAVNLGLSVIGTVGVLLSAKKSGHIDAVGRSSMQYANRAITYPRRSFAQRLRDPASGIDIRIRSKLS